MLESRNELRETRGGNWRALDSIGANEDRYEMLLDWNPHFRAGARAGRIDFVLLLSAAVLPARARIPQRIA